MIALELKRPGAMALLVGVAGLLASAVLLVFQPAAILAGWLAMALFLLSLPVGAMTLLMIHMLTGGAWGNAVRQPLRVIAATLPFALILLLPVLVAMLVHAGLVFEWAGDGPFSETVRHKFAFLNLPFFVLRFAVYAVVWLALLAGLLGWTRDGPPPRARARRTLQRNCALGLVAHALVITFFSVDWMMSLEPEFYSTIYAMLEAAGGVVGAYALALIAVASAEAVETEPGGKEGVALSEDMANILFGFVLMWAYLAFMQWLIVWAADLPIEIHWYLRRVRDGWQFVLWVLIALHFAVPFAGFLVRDLKRSHAGIMALAGIVLAGHFLDVYWRVRPVAGADGAPWLDPLAFAGAGGLWLALFLHLRAQPARLERFGWRHAHG